MRIDPMIWDEILEILIHSNAHRIKIIEYDEFGNKIRNYISVRNRMLFDSEYRYYDAKTHNVSEIVKTDMRKNVKYHCDGKHKIRSAEFADKKILTCSYDMYDRIRTIKIYNPANGSNRSFQFIFNNSGNLIKVIDSCGITKRYHYSKINNVDVLIHTIDSKGNEQFAKFDPDSGSPFHIEDEYLTLLEDLQEAALYGKY